MAYYDSAILNSIRPVLNLHEMGSLAITGTVIHKMGYNPSISGANQEDMWQIGGTYVFPTAAMGMEVVSSDNTNDKTGGTGALAVKIEYLTDAFVEKSEVITLNGTAAVPTVALDIYRINSFRVVSAGTGGAAAGNISIRHLSDTPIYGYIAAGQTRSRNLIYTVPVGKILLINAFAFASSGTTSDASYLKFTVYANQDYITGLASTIKYPIMEIAVQGQGNIYNMQSPLVIKAGVDTRIVVIGIAGTTTADALASWRGVLMKV